MWTAGENMTLPNSGLQLARVVQLQYVTGFVKINPNCTRTEIHFIAEH